MTIKELPDAKESAKQAAIQKLRQQDNIKYLLYQHVANEITKAVEVGNTSVTIDFNKIKQVSQKASLKEMMSDPWYLYKTDAIRAIMARLADKGYTLVGDMHTTQLTIRWL